MKIYPHRNITNTIKAGCIAGLLLITPQNAPPQTPTKRGEMIRDTFEKTAPAVPPKGTTDMRVLYLAPSPEIRVKGVHKTAKFVVDLSQNVLYHYDEVGLPIAAYLVASGKPATPTDKGVRIVSHTERHPYTSAPAHTKRRKNPNDYGPRAIILDKLDVETGKRSSCGEFIHGNNKPSSIGQYASKGCIRMDNEVIKILAKETKRGDIVIVK